MSDGGKGDKRRPTDEQKYQSNWDLIFGKKNNANQTETHSGQGQLAQEISTVPKKD